MTFEEIVERFSVIGEEDSVVQKLWVALFGGIAFAACTVIAVFYRIKYGEAINTDSADYHCRNDV